MILTITGASGVGKTTFLKTLQKACPHVHLLTSTTTRPARGDEGPGEYEHVSAKEFETLAQRGEFLEVFERYGNRYGTKLSRIDSALGVKEIYAPVLLLPAVMRFYERAKVRGKEKRIRSIFLDLPDEREREKRLRARAEAHPERWRAELERWRSEARVSGIPFIYLDASLPPEKLIAQALEFIKK
jgi:guanylate kinase